MTTRNFNHRQRFRQSFNNGGSTQQHFKDVCDINGIVNRFKSTGVITHLARRQGSYGFASAQSFTEAAFIVANVTSEFAAMPAKIRTHFDNNVAAFLDAAQDPDRRPELEELGLLEPLPTPEVEDPPPGLSEPLPNPAPEAPKTLESEPN